MGAAQSDFSRSTSTVARGAGKTIIEGGTGKKGGSVRILTTIAFHSERTAGGAITGDFECLARAPETETGNDSADFTVNAMYVSGQIKTAVVQGDAATLSGTANITGLGAGTDVPFTVVVKKGGPGATAVLTTTGPPELVFHEILLEGRFEVSQDKRDD
jgi:hypothetical protein